MGGYFSQEIEVVSPDKECTGTPHASSLGKLFTFMNDPRSPSSSNFSRTPILVQESLVDPRSPGNELVERTPLYDAASTPVVRFKLENKGFQASPIITGEGDSLEDTKPLGYSSSLSNEAYQHSPGVPIAQSRTDASSKKSDGIEDIDEDYDFEIIGENLEEVAENTCAKIPEASNKENRTLRTKTQLKKRFNATQKSILKTVLFKPYEELNGEEMNLSSSEITPKKKPLGTKKDSNTYGDAGTAKTLIYGNKRVGDGLNSPTYKLPLRELSLCDKENVIQG